MKKFSFVFFLWLCFLCSSAFAQETVWTNNLADKIQTLSGSAVVDLIDEDAATPWGIAVDTDRQKIYWTNVTEGTVRSSDLSGGNVQTVITGLSLPRGLALDAVSNTLYWAEAGHGSQSLKRMNLDDESVTVITSSAIISPYHIALDRENGLLYWVDNALGQKNISRINVDGSGRETIISTINQVAGITLDPANGFIYWADFEDDVIYRAETSGMDQAIEAFYEMGEQSTPWALFLDSQNDALFWTDYLNSSVSRIDTNTNESELWVSNVTTPSGFFAFSFVTNTEITGSPGWRMMGVPVSGVTVGDLANENLVQGVPGLPYDGFISNFYTWDPAAESGDPEDPLGSYLVPESGATVMSPGNGFIWYMWGPESRPDVPESRPFPVTIEASGGQLTGDVSLGTLAEGWNLIANPFAVPIAFNELTDGTDPLNIPGYVWDPNEGATGSYLLTTSAALDNTLADWQGAFIELSEATEVVIPQSARQATGAFRPEAPHAEPLTHGQIEFMLEGFDDDSGSKTSDLAAILYFHEHATHNWDTWDISKLTPLSQTYATVAFVGERKGEPVLKAQHALPYTIEGVYEIPLDIQLQNVSGSFRLSWPVVSDLPADAEFLLLDTHTGQEYDLSLEGHVDFTMTDSNKGESAVPSPYSRPEIKTMGLKEGGQRFVILAGSLTTSAGTQPDLPTEVVLRQNYPNPFNPTTVISYELPSAQHVRLQVFDMTGRLVATLVNEQVSAGSHAITFDAERLSSGVYVYRLQTAGSGESGGSVFTRKLTLIK